MKRHEQELEPQHSTFLWDFWTLRGDMDFIGMLLPVDLGHDALNMVRGGNPIPGP